ncbi:MAG: hypothetical protein U0325_24430 [Polyangiales bacterium]
MTDAGSPCDAFTEGLVDDGPLPDALRAHARACAACGMLLRVPAALDLDAPRDLEPGLALREALQHATPVHRPPTLVRAAPTVVVVLGAMGASALLSDAGSQRWALGLTLTVTAAAGFALVFWRGVDGIGAPARWRRWFPVGAAGLAVIAARTQATDAHALRAGPGRLPSPGTAVDAVQHSLPAAGDDASATLAAALLVAALGATTALLGTRRSTPSLPALSGATLGAAAALLGLSVAHHGAPMPVLAHAAVVVLASVLGAGIGRRTLSP